MHVGGGDSETIFISYRRTDTAGHAGRLYDTLMACTPRPNVFMDIDSIDPGVDFREALRRAVAQCDSFLALIGPAWATARDEAGNIRLHDPNDFVRLELEAALERGVRVIPVLVGEARMPRASELPPPLARITDLQALPLSDQRWRYDVGQLELAIGLSRDDAQSPTGEASPKPRAWGRSRPAATSAPGTQGTRPTSARHPPGTPGRATEREPWWRARRPLIGVSILLVLALAAVVVWQSSGPSGAPEVGPVAYPITYVAKACSSSVVHDIPVPGMKCGTLTVPEDRSKPRGRVVRLEVVRAPARSQPMGDPVLDFGADTLTTSPARDHREEIQVSGRGWTGTLRSNPALTCPEYASIAPDSLTRPAADPGEQLLLTQAIRTCYDRWTRAGVDLNQYNYLTTGDDMADLIRALHFQHVNLVSGYVATIGALEVVRQLPGVVRSLTLQEPIAPGQSGYTNPARYLSDAFNGYVSLCQADAACKATFQDLPGAYRRDHELTQATPRLAQGDDGNGHSHAVLLDGDRTTQALADALSNRQTYPLIAAAITAPVGTPAVDSAVAGRAIDANVALLNPDYAWGAELSGQCSYEAHTVDQAGSSLTRQTFPQFSKVDDQSLQPSCAAWPVRKISQRAFDDPSTTVPTLIVTPILQPAADPQWADIFRRGLPNATVLTFSTLDGNVLGTSDPPCLATLRRAFITDPSKRLATTPCERQSPPIRFLASLGG